MTDIHARYLGDGVYASFDGYQVKLDLRGQEEIDGHKTEIYLDLEVWEALQRFMKDYMEEYPSPFTEFT
jgi:hypothetical protein